MKIIPTLRQISQATFVAALTTLPVWAWSQLQSISETQPEKSCGMPILAVYALSMLGISLLSITSVGLGFLAYRKSPTPRSKLQKIELGVFATPAAACLIGFLIFYI